MKEMASSDDEGEMVPKNVSDYAFFCDNESSVSFSNLPVDWDGSGTHRENGQSIFLSGKTDNGILPIYKEVVAWKFELSRERPETSVLSIEGHWIKLLKPRKAFQDIIRTIQITLYFLHYVRRNPQQSEKALWDFLNKTFSMFERRPCEDDLVDHMPLINEAVKRDQTLASSKLLHTFLKEKPRRRKNFNEDVNPPFIVDDINEEENSEDFDENDESDGDEFDEEDCFDYVCAFCDNGGEIYICEGKCMRSFHATVEHGEESNCESLGFTEAQLEAMNNVPFYCKNCSYKQHQCFACGKLGSSDESSGAEVFCCFNGACGHFYHPSCVARLLHPDDRAAGEELHKRIAAGEEFVCPAHRCHVCKELEVRSNRELQFAVCRRCPRVYHRKCLPRDIASEEDVDEEAGILQRAWEGLIPNRILIYCLKHKIDPEIATPVRDHIKFPGLKNDKEKSSSLDFGKKRDSVKGRGFVPEDNAGKRSSAKSIVKVPSSLKQGDCSRTVVEKPAPETLMKVKVATNRNSLGKLKESAVDREQMSLGDKLYTAFYGMDSESEKSSRGANDRGDQERTHKVKPVGNRINNSVSLNADSQNRILELMKGVSRTTTIDQVREKHKSPSTQYLYSKLNPENITMGKVEGAIQAVRTALKKLDDGGSVQDAKAVCGDDLLIQVFKWKEKFKVYLAPFLHGMRYTSFGRHFTKVDKLKEVANILQWYIQDNDMLVDFCCGSNDFSCLVKKKLDEMGKKCSFKNYDILQAKNDFCFERRDWMGVKPAELPKGSQLVMGLNPPFGVNAGLANKFIEKALEFKPKLIILIVPRETQRLDEKGSPYDLIWEDDQMFVGKSFYLPGSVDINDKQIEDWNVSAPVLYLWSRRDWTVKHRAIAEQYGHFPRMQKESHNEMQAPKHSQESENLKESKGEELCPVKPKIHEQKGKATVGKCETHEQKGKVAAGKSEIHIEKAKATAVHLEGLPHDSNGAKGDNSGHKEKNCIVEDSKSGGKRKRKRRSNNNFPEENSRALHSVSRHTPPNIVNHVLVETHSPRLIDTPSQVHSWRDGYQQQFDQRNFSTYHHLAQNVYNGNQEPDGMMRARMYSLNNEEPFLTATSRNAYGPSPQPEYGMRASSERWMGPEEMGSTQYIGDVSVRYSIDVHVEPNPWNQRGVLPPSYPGPGYPSPLGQMHPAMDSTYSGMNNASAMQRYASRLGLDEMSPPMGGMPSRPPVQDAGGMYHLPGANPMNHVSSLAFGSAPRGPYPHQNSSGWLHK